MPLWDNTTISTDLSLRRYESRITDLKSVDSGSDELSTTGEVDLVSIPSADMRLMSVGGYLTADDTNVTITEVDNDNDTVTVSVAVDWSAGYTYAVQSWADKIGLAKDVLKRRITMALIDSGRAVSRGAGQDYIDLVADPAHFAQASDYLCLSMIYQELANMGSHELHFAKASYYDGQYERAFALAIRTVDISNALTGTADEYDTPVSWTSPCLR